MQLTMSPMPGQGLLIQKLIAQTLRRYEMGTGLSVSAEKEDLRYSRTQKHVGKKSTQLTHPTA